MSREPKFDEEYLMFSLKRKKRKLYIDMLTGVIAAIIGSVMITYFVKSDFIDTKKVDESKYKKQFFSSVDNVISSKDSLIINIETIRKVYNSIDRESNGELFNYGFINLLEDYLVIKIQDSTEINRVCFEPVLKMIKDELKLEPYSHLSSEQRRILTNLDRALQEDDKILAQFNLTELNDLLKIQNEELRKLETQNKWSIPMGIIGAVLTLLFGLMSIFRPLSYRKIGEIVKVSVERDK